ncbi:cytochrome c [Kaustia mangrovi]|uniref:Cytochrome c n=1 Tax=Kaustia mangrovi TaxID=2593653 RepID=A0A7S8HC09_9HYPH|nr:cytochrome c [Kaustia mangrovi]QPC43140.1 cytochrome c [Kaustia mangrovi]
MFSKRLTVPAALCALILGLAVGSHAPSAQDADPIKAREDAMKAIGKQMGALAAIVKGESAFSGPAVEQAANEIDMQLKTARDLFPEGSTSPDSRAKPEIWETPDDFMAKMDDAEAAAAKLADVGANGDEGAFRQAFMGLGGTCKACHEKYRKPEDS